MPRSQTKPNLLNRWIRAGADLFGLRPKVDPRADFSRRVRREAHRIVREVRAKYDAAQTTDENRKHWANADALSANAANSPEVRAKLRNRSRYERDNNSYFEGIVHTLAGDLIGTGPRLQLMTSSETLNRTIEREFGFWCDAIDLPGKLNLTDMARHVDGEGFLIAQTNRKLSTPVQLDYLDIECDQFTDGTLSRFYPTQRAVDGIRFDAYRNPTNYMMLPMHPGDEMAPGSQKPVPMPASNVLHWFVPTRPGQARGIPTVTPALGLFAQLRRYSQAVLIAAEIAAELAAFMESNLPAGDGSDGGDTDFDLLEIVRGQITTLPGGWKISQLNPTQPTTTFSDFVNAILREIARCLQMPWGLAAGDSSSYNYASGRLDVQTYLRMIKLVRARLERLLIDKIFTSWLDEAILIPNYLPMNGQPPYRDWAWRWHWDGFEHVDPSKEANALETLLRINATTLETAFAAKGQDWMEALQQIAKEKKVMQELGLTTAATTPAPAGPPELNPADAEAEHATAS